MRHFSLCDSSASLSALLWSTASLGPCQCWAQALMGLYHARAASEGSKGTASGSYCSCAVSVPACPSSPMHCVLGWRALHTRHSRSPCCPCNTEQLLGQEEDEAKRKEQEAATQTEASRQESDSNPSPDATSTGKVTCASTMQSAC